MLEKLGQAAKQAAYQLAQCPAQQKNKALQLMADLLVAHSEAILAANQQDMQLAQQAGLSPAMQDRLLLTAHRLASIADDVYQISLLADPVGEVIDGRTL